MGSKIHKSFNSSPQALRYAKIQDVKPDRTNYQTSRVGSLILNFKLLF